jgi:hypothetical protein
MVAISDLQPAVTKRCYRCSRELPLERFNRNRSRKDGYAHRCRECVAEHLKTRREQRKQYSAEYREVNRESLNKQQSERYRGRCEERRKYRIEHRRTPSGYVTSVWYSLNCRTENGSHPDYNNPHCRIYLNRGVLLLITREKLEAKVRQDWPIIKPILDSGQRVHVHRIGPSIHYSADNIEFISEAEHRERHRSRHID